MAQSHSPESADAVKPLLGRRVGWSVMALVFFVGCWIRFKIATGELLWLDELHTGWAVGGSFQEMLTRSAQGNQAPLFYGLEWLLVQTLGSSELTLRLVSLAAGALAMAMAGRLVWQYTGSAAAAAVTLTLIAVDHNFIRYSAEARPYALLHLASLIQVGCFWRLVEHWRRTNPDDSAGSDRFGIFWLVLSSWLLAYTHYTAVFLLVTEFVFLLALLPCWWLSGGLTKRTLKQIFATLILFTVGCLPLLFQMNQAFGKPADWSSVASLETFLASQKINGMGWFGIPLGAVLLSMGIVALFRRRLSDTSRSDRWRQVRWLGWVAAWFAIPLLTIVLLQTEAGIPIALSRYLSVALIAGPVFAGGIVGVGSVRSRWIAIPIVFLASIFLHERTNSLAFEIVRSGQLPLLRTENWQAAIEAVNKSPDKAQWPLFLFGAIVEDEHALVDPDADFQAYLQFPVRGLYELDSSQRVVFAGPTMSRHHFDDRYLDDVVEQGGAWILVRHEAEVTVEIVNQLVVMLHGRLENSTATVETNWFGNRNNVVQLISVEIKP